MKQQISPLPYFADSAALFSTIADQPWAVFLDSGYPNSRQGRYDIIAAEPIRTLLTYGNETVIRHADGEETSNADPFELVKQELAMFAGFKPAADAGDWPFCGGAIGYFAYDLARRLEKLPTLAENAERIPDMAIGIYRWAVVVDHQRQQTLLTGIDCEDAFWQALIVRFSRLPEPRPLRPFRLLEAIRANMDRAAYYQAFERVKHYLREGDCYQINLTQRFGARCEGDPWTVYRVLREVNAAPFGGYLNLPGVQILSSSPERFLKVESGRVETKPIKGTRPRKLEPFEDQRQIEALQNSAKDRAENVMIVDLLRNDLGKTCKIGTVKTPSLFAVESYATVHHLVSTVTGQLRDDRHALDLLESCFPGGSITGAPKIRAMAVIEELEPNRRGVYCGSLGYIGFDGNMDTNIAIRTLVHEGGRIRFWAGGGIVDDSSVDAEYQECFDKAAALFAVLQRFAAA